MGSGGGQSGTSSTQNEIAPELQPLFRQTGETIMGLQPMATHGGGQFFNPNIQNIPGFTAGQQAISDFQQQRAFNPQQLNSSELAAQGQLMDLVNSPVGSAPSTIAAMSAARAPVLNDLALSGLGNSDAVGTNLLGAYAPIIAQEQQMRMQAIPQLQQLGATAANRQTQTLADYGATQEASRNITETQGKADLADFLRRQGLFSNFTTGLLGGFPSVSGSSTTTKSSGGGK